MNGGVLLCTLHRRGRWLCGSLVPRLWMQQLVRGQYDALNGARAVERCDAQGEFDLYLCARACAALGDAKEVKDRAASGMSGAIVLPCARESERLAGRAIRGSLAAERRRRHAACIASSDVQTCR